jgi:hypothetical protein
MGGYETWSDGVHPYGAVCLTMSQICKQQIDCREQQRPRRVCTELANAGYRWLGSAPALPPGVAQSAQRVDGATLWALICACVNGPDPKGRAVPLVPAAANPVVEAPSSAGELGARMVA